MPNIAAIDIGSNAIRMMVARIQVDGKLETLENIRLPVRLGKDAFMSGQFTEQTMQSAVDAFHRFKKVAELFEATQIRAVATSAMRETSNSDLLIDRVARETGINIEVISGEEEARLIHVAVASSINLQGKKTILIDIGGGSAEVTITNDENIISLESYPLGTVRLLQKLSETDERKIPFTRLIQEYADSAKRMIERELQNEKPEICVGTGGNIEEMGKLRKKLFKRERDNLITMDELEQLIEKLSQMSVSERMKKLDLRQDRADVILPAAVVLHMIASEAGVKEIQIPGVGLKDGVLLEMAPLAIGPRLPRREQVISSAMRMGKKYNFDAGHATFTARLAVQLFNQTLSLHQLTENDRLLLEVSALLHDIGHFINTLDHDKHGFYLLKHHPLIGLTPAEQTIVANVVRHHRKDSMLSFDENIKQMTPKDRLITMKLCALLRIADALDSSHSGKLRDIVLEQDISGGWQIHIISGGDSFLEKWTLEKRKALFQEIFGVKVSIA